MFSRLNLVLRLNAHVIKFCASATPYDEIKLTLKVVKRLLISSATTKAFEAACINGGAAPTCQLTAITLVVFLSKIIKAKF